jgi:teichuronic acid biosynthesis glycosyltransferase TuaC
MNHPDLTRGTKAVRVLTLTPFYPSAQDDTNGCFVAEPFPWLEQNGVQNTILAVQPLYRGCNRGTDCAPSAEWISYLAPPGKLGLAASGSFLYARILATVRKLHESQGIDLIHAHAPLPCGHAAALLSRELGIPYVLSVHGLDAFSSANAGGYAARWNRRVAEMVYREARRIICVSRHVCDEVLNGMGNHWPVSVVYNGVDPNFFSPGPDLDATHHTILSIGNLIPTKGHELLLRAVAELKRTGMDLTCVIVGDGPERTRLEKIARGLRISDRTVFAGRQSRASVAAFFQQSTIFCLPSRYEGLGCVYLEAMAAGKPAIGCRGQGIEEIIQHNVNGCLIDSNNVDELAITIAQLIEDAALSKTIGSAGRRTILNGFTLSHQAQRLSALYRECVA